MGHGKWEGNRWRMRSFHHSLLSFFLAYNLAGQWPTDTQTSDILLFLFGCVFMHPCTPHSHSHAQCSPHACMSQMVAHQGVPHAEEEKKRLFSLLT